jgi:hypothetical protein
VLLVLFVALALLLMLAAVVALFALVISGIMALAVLPVVAGIVGLVLILGFLNWALFGVHRLNLGLVGLGGATSIPAVPFQVSVLPDTVQKLLTRVQQIRQAVYGLSAIETIAGTTANAYTFMGMGYADPAQRALDPRTRLPLDRAEQYSMGWTTFGGVHAAASASVLPGFAATLTNPAAATAAFWPTIATFGVPYNLLVLQRIRADDSRMKTRMGAAWTPEMERVWTADALFVIDMTLFTGLAPRTANFVTRFTPGTLTFLERDTTPARALAPFAIRVSDGTTTVDYASADPAWLYALQAAKTSIAVWGIWIGHVYHWHIVTAAMQMTMFQLLPPAHPVRQCFGYQSDYLIGFDQFLLLDWNIAPPTSITSSRQFLSLMDMFAAGRTFSQDDPLPTLAAFGITAADFTTTLPFDQYPVAEVMVMLWTATSAYTTGVVNAWYPDDLSVVADAPLQEWIRWSGDARGGNVAGLPPMTSRAALIGVLTSLVYRVTAHGASRLMQAANPALSFTPNFPPCLQSAVIPAPSTPVEFRGAGGALPLNAFLPNTGTMGELANFLFTFVYSPPYVPFVPLDDRAPLPFTGPQPIVAACDAALLAFRGAVMAVLDRYAAIAGVPGLPAQVHQWELNIET